MSKIEKPWCVVCTCSKKGIYNIPKHIGKVEKEENIGSWKGSWIRYYEQQRSPDYWDKKCISRFKTIGGAIRKYARLLRKPLKKIRDNMLNSFPSEKEVIKKIKV